MAAPEADEPVLMVCTDWLFPLAPVSSMPLQLAKPLAFTDATHIASQALDIVVVDDIDDKNLLSSSPVQHRGCLQPSPDTGRLTPLPLSEDESSKAYGCLTCGQLDHTSRFCSQVISSLFRLAFFRHPFLSLFLE